MTRCSRSECSERGPARTNSCTVQFPPFAVERRCRRGMSPGTLGRLFDGIVTGPVFDAVNTGIRLGPRNANRVHRLGRSQIHDNPLRVVVFASERLRKVGITLPIRTCRPVGHPGVTGIRSIVSREPPRCARYIPIGNDESDHQGPHFQ